MEFISKLNRCLSQENVGGFFWILNAPTLSQKPLDDYVDFLDAVVCGDLPSEEEDSCLYNLDERFQMHCHSKTCREYKNIAVVLNLGALLQKKS